MAEHDGRGALQAHPVSLAHDFQPLLRIQLVGADTAHAIVENFGRGARQGREPSGLQFAQIFPERQSQGLRSVSDSSGEKAWTCICGTASFTAATISR